MVRAEPVELQPPFRAIPAHGPYCWQVVLPTDLREQGDDNDHGSQSVWRLYEDDTEIGRPHADHRRIGKVGLGFYSHWMNTLYFSTSDNSDPNLNGRKYVLRRPSAAARTDPTQSAALASEPAKASRVNAVARPSPFPSSPVGWTCGRSVFEFDPGDGSRREFDIGQLPHVCNSLDILVFRNRTVRWDEVIPDFVTRSMTISPCPVLKSFASPGQAAVRTAAPAVTYEDITFPDDGIYNVLTQFGVFRFLILPAKASAADVVGIGRFFSANTVHSGTDVAVCSYGGNVELAIYYPNLFQKLFRSDQPLGLDCGQASMALSALYRTLGYETRQVHFDRGHFSTEVHDGDRWVLVDPDFDCVVRDQSGELLDADAVAGALLLGEQGQLQVESLSEKRRLKPELRFLGGFGGQRSWRPEDADTDRCSDAFLSELNGSLVRRRTPAFEAGVVSMAWFKEAREDADEPNTRIPIGEQVERQRKVIAGRRELHALYGAAVAQLDITANQRLIYRHGASSGFDSPLREADCAFWLRQKLEIAVQLELHKAEPQRILEIGAGGGHFPFVGRMLGHDAVGVDIDIPVYDDVCKLLGVNRVPLRLERGQRLPDLGGRFSLITAVAAHMHTLGASEFWTKQDWRTFIDDLILNQIEAPGRIYFTLNAEWDVKVRQWRFEDQVAEVFAEYGAVVDTAGNVVDLPVPKKLVETVRSRDR
jgi:hypothetical protein